MHMKKPQIPVAILVRVSTAKQDKARQISELRQYADGKGYDVIEVCQETIQAARKITSATDCVERSNSRARAKSRRSWSMKSLV